ncbi:DNA-binding protein [Flavobacterium sp. F-380]|uniref:DNA-binding protein n=1 Tax=Flavobacterium kayseriense TaxID=2764714 RepID=A0ABR7JAJ2_9FLAO|nr:DNA-binding protein [Flavobacterium kayseriense]MBC5842462.1 DNA-binding protein [Flavobacterium kayseriense]MBC5848992.1 DNA-binding protein [Flavobacterium kayseriense]
MTNSILLENVSPEKLTELITTVFKKELEDFKKQLITQSENEDLLNREQLLELLQINASTLWHWQNKGRITVYKFANKCYYKRSEIMQSLIALKK